MNEEKALAELLNTMQEQGRPVQQGGFSVEAIPTGITSFDHSTGIGGVPRRRISIFQGEEASGKTLLLLVLIANLQRQGGRAAFVDLEHALTPSFARLLGVEYDDLVISRPRTLEQAYDIAKELGESGLFDVVGFDSAVALSPESDLEKSASQGVQRAGQAQVHSQELKKMVSLLHDRTALVMINQLRENPNPPGWWSGGKMLYSPGGRALGFYCSLRVDVKATKNYKDSSGKRIGHRVMTRISKNKVAQPWGEATFDLQYATGLDLVVDLVETALELGIVTRKSSWYYYDWCDQETGEVIEEIKTNGREAFEQMIREHTDLEHSLRNDIEGEGYSVAEDLDVEERVAEWGEVVDG